MSSMVPRRAGMMILESLVVAAAVVASALVAKAADRDYLIVNPPDGPRRPHAVSRPAWIWSIEYPYGRYRHDSILTLACLTLGAAALLAIDGRTWRHHGFLRPGALAVAVATLIGGAGAVTQALVGRPTYGGPRPSIWFDLSNVLEFQTSGAVLGAWALLALGGLWRPCQDWRDGVGRLIGLGWLGTLILLPLQAVLFG